MCDFCNKIYSIYEIDNTSHWNLPYSLILKDSKNNFHIYTTCDDDYYSAISVRDIHYCPKCGKALN